MLIATNISLLGLCFISIMGIFVLFLPRRLIFIPIIITTCYITIGEQLLFLGFNFTTLRIVILLAWMRVITRREISALQLNSIDKAIICWLVVSFIITLLWQTSYDLQYRLGYIYNAAGLYFLFRIIIRDISETEYVIKISAIIILPLSIFMIWEAFSGRNFFSIFGGVSEISWIRDGAVRAQGPFRWAGLAGVVGAVLMPLFVSLWFSDKAKFNSIVGFVAATIITVTSHSSGPLMSYCAAIVGLMMWPFHSRMRTVRLAIFFTLISLHMVMKAPVWSLIYRIGGLVGGGGYHRSAIIDAAVKHFNEWWLIGTKHTAHWMPYTLGSEEVGQLHADITNQYISEGIGSGLATMLLFIYIIIVCFREIGISLRLNENQPFSVKIILWSVGTSLFVHVLSFLSTTYFDQTIVFWYLTLSMVSAVCIQNKTDQVLNPGKKLTVQNRLDFA